MKKENEKDFLKHFVKYVNSMDKIGILVSEVKRRYALNDKLHYVLRKYVNRIFFSYDVFAKHCHNLEDNAKKMKSLLSEENFILDKQKRIIHDMENIAKITGKVVQLKLSSLLEKINSLLKKSIKLQSDSFSFDITFATVCVLSGGYKEIIKNACSGYPGEAEKYAFKIKRNLDKLIKLDIEINLLLSKNDNIQKLFGENKEFKKFQKINLHIKKQAGLKDYLKKSKKGS